MTRTALLILASLLFPVAAFAQSIPAGFPSGSVWLSDFTPEDGDTVRLYAPVYNSTSADIEGEVAFWVDSENVATAQFSLDSRESRIVSVEWKAKEGDHDIHVSIRNAHRKGSSETLTLQEGENTKVAVSVSPAPPTKAERLAKDASAYLTSVSPEAATVLGSLGTATEGLREAGIAYIEERLEAAAPPQASSDTQVLGASTYNSPAAAVGMLDRAWGGLLKGLLFVFQLQFLFYLLLLFVIYILWKLIRVFFADRRNRI